MRQHPYRKIIVIVDRAPVHRAGCIQQFVEQNKKRFALYYLSPYAPELNPDEEVWNHLKNNKLKAHQARTKKRVQTVNLCKNEESSDESRLNQIFLLHLWAITHKKVYKYSLCVFSNITYELHN